MHDGELLDCGNYARYFFDANTGIWWHCEDDEITEINDLVEGVYIVENYKKHKEEIYVRIRQNTVNGFYHNK